MTWLWLWVWVSVVQSVIAAKILNRASDNDLFPVIQQETDTEVFWMARSSLLNRKQSQNYQVERMLEQKYLNLGGVDVAGKVKPWRLQCYRCGGRVDGWMGDG